MIKYNQQEHLPAIALRGMTILPGMIAHFDINRTRSIHAVEKAMSENQQIFLVAQRDSDEEEPSMEGLYRIGVIASVRQIIKMKGGVVRILVEAKGRAELLRIDSEENSCLVAEVLILETDTGEAMLPEAKAAMVRNIRETYGKYVTMSGRGGKEFMRQIDEVDDPSLLMDQVVNNLSVSYTEKQRYLEAATLEERFAVLMGILLSEINVASFQKEFREKVKEQVDNNQKEYLLREQMKVIKKELKEDNTESDADEFRRKLGELECSEEIRERIGKEIDRFLNISQNSSESAVARGYIETLLSLPWDKASVDNRDLARAEEVLEKEHYGLKKVKERMLEFLAVRNLTEKGESPIICLVGPPGTGKTSIAKSVAEALDKKFVRIGLGGVRDEAEIRGHRRTYVGAMPGRLAQALRYSGVKNPLILLDEIDKTSSDYKGDTSSALLEVLDSEQNHAFRDHYVELPIDLSEVLFIATANNAQDIPRPLYDRMEVIEVSSYTENEKLHIAKEHLIPKQAEKNGLKEGQISITDKAIQRLIRHYTREAGVRSLERKIGELCRKTARAIYEGKEESVRFSAQNLESYLGKQKYTFDKRNKEDEVGIVRGLAWTSVGGDTLEIEVNVMPGKGDFELTGQLGDVMKESARAGISYIRSVSKKYKIPKEFFRENDLHIHIPEGAVPKDGPSAGITMATAMLSAITGKKIRADIAMTGEITLRGRVLPIGGLKEKILAAKNAGIEKVLVPRKNEKDIEEIEDEIKEGIEIVYVETMDEVLKEAIAKS